MSFETSDFSIGHRGACMMYPEHTVESYVAAGLMGAGIIECDVTFTKDLELICRHSQCDLHTTTDVVAHPELNAKCTTPWSTGVSPKCCASDFTLEEIQSLCGKMDAAGDVNAETAEGYVYGGTADWRTDLYSHPGTCPKIPTHAESIELIKKYHGKFTPELKGPSVEMPFGDFTQEDYAQKMIDEYIAAGVPPSDVWPQSFNDQDVIYWVENTDYGDQAVALDNKYDAPAEEFMAWFEYLSSNGVKIVAPPMWMLVEADDGSADLAPLSQGLGIKPSAYVEGAKTYGLDIITWTLERTGPGLSGWYWQTLQDIGLTEGDQFALLQVLAEDAGVLGVFSDWPATTTFFANCLGYGLREEEEETDCATIADVCGNEDFSTLCGLLTEYDLVDTVVSGKFNIFAPNNEAFETIAAVLPTLSEETVVNVLKFHLAAGSDAIPLTCKETIEMVNGQDSRTVCDRSGAVYQLGGDNRPAGTFPAFLSEGAPVCGGGVFYEMSEVLLPGGTL